jgi:cyclophilin family peptidyl-prolyl cis-trans isomerase
MKVLSALIVFAAFASAQDLPSKPGLYAIFDTSAGVITARLYEKEAPLAVQNFVGLAQGTKAWRDPQTGAPVKRPLYRNITFHRILPGEMIQSGDPTGTGAHPCGITIPDEFLPGLRFDRGGRLAVANTGQPDSGGCQFFITAGPVPQWNDHYTIFGDVISGLDVVAKINRAPLHGDRPVDPAKLIGVTIQRVGPEPGHKNKK